MYERRQIPLGTPLAHPCPECGARMILKYTKDYFYGCIRYPLCRGTHSAHADGHPMGKPADRETKNARHACHTQFDLLWRTGLMNRDDAYDWLRKRMGLPAKRAHIGRFNLKQCQRLIKILDEYEIKV